MTTINQESWNGQEEQFERNNITGDRSGYARGEYNPDTDEDDQNLKDDDLEGADLDTDNADEWDEDDINETDLDEDDLRDNDEINSDLHSVKNDQFGSLASSLQNGPDAQDIRGKNKPENVDFDNVPAPDENSSADVIGKYKPQNVDFDGTPLTDNVATGFAGEGSTDMPVNNLDAQGIRGKNKPENIDFDDVPTPDENSSADVIGKYKPQNIDFSNVTADPDPDEIPEESELDDVSELDYPDDDRMEQAEDDEVAYKENNEVEQPRETEAPAKPATLGNLDATVTDQSHNRTTGRMIDHEPGSGGSRPEHGAYNL